MSAILPLPPPYPPLGIAPYEPLSLKPNRILHWA